MPNTIWLMPSQGRSARFVLKAIRPEKDERSYLAATAPMPCSPFD